MSISRSRALRLFGKEAYLSKPFQQKCRLLPKGSDEWMMLAVARHYPLFRKLKHGLVLGQLSAGMPQGYAGPGLQFIYKLLAHKVCFLDLEAGGYSRAQLDAIEAEFDL